MSQIISASYDPSVSGLAGNVGDIVEVAGGGVAWVKFDVGVTDWQPFPGAGGAGTVVTDATLTGDGSIATPLGVAPGASWYDLEAAVHAAAVPELTESISIPVGLSHEGAAIAAAAADAAIEGGGLRGNSDTVAVLLTKGSIFQAIQTSKFAISFQARLSVIAVGKYSLLGLFDAASPGKELIVGTQQSTDAANFMAYAYDGVGVTPTITLGTADLLMYTWRIISDGATVTISRSSKAGGGVALASGTVATNASHFPTGKVFPGIFNAASTTNQAVTKVLYSFVTP